MSEQFAPPVSKTRDSNLELFRIIVMLLIVAHHYVVNSEVSSLMRSDDITFRSIFFNIFGAWGKTGINCFVLITGYFMCLSKITLKKFLKLYLEIKFYQYLIWAIFFAFGLSTFSLKTIVGILPFTVIGTSFTNAYMAFFLFIPFMNNLIRNMNRKQHIVLVLLLVFIYTILAMAQMVTYNYLSWFVTLYFIASYIRFYNIPYQNSLCFWGWTTLVILCLDICSIFLPLLIHRAPSYYFISDSNHLGALLLSISSFMFFKNLKIGHSIIINSIGATTFGVFLIHTRGDEMRHWLWYSFLDNGSHYSYQYYWAYAIISVVGIFTVCSIIDRLRINILEKNVFALYDRFDKNRG